MKQWGNENSLHYSKNPQLESRLSEKTPMKKWNRLEDRKRAYHDLGWNPGNKNKKTGLEFRG
jgi:hypothetical protein